MPRFRCASDANTKPTPLTCPGRRKYVVILKLGSNIHYIAVRRFGRVRVAGSKIQGKQIDMQNTMLLEECVTTKTKNAAETSDATGGSFTNRVREILSGGELHSIILRFRPTEKVRFVREW